MALLRQKIGYTFGYTMVTQCEKCVTFFFETEKALPLTCFNPFRVEGHGGRASFSAV